MFDSDREYVPGDVIVFRYPRHNFNGVVSKLEPRRLRVESVTDLMKEPLERETFEIQPLLKRSRFLLTGQDLDKLAERSFYVGSMRAVRKEA